MTIDYMATSWRTRTVHTVLGWRIFIQQQLNRYRVWHFTGFWLRGFSNHFLDQSFYLLGRAHPTRYHSFHYDNAVHPGPVSVVQNFLVYRVWVATVLLLTSVHQSQLRYHHSDQRLIVNGHTSIGILEELTWDYWMREHVSSQGFFYLPHQTILFCTTVRLACF